MNTNGCNVFHPIPDASRTECFTTLLEAPSFRCERIVSHGQSTPKGEWLVQDQHEWVMVLQGSAGLLFENENVPRIMGPGDYVEIPAHCRHRVEWTDSDMSTIWLAIHFDRHTG